MSLLVSSAKSASRIFDSLEVEEKKKEALFAKLSALEQEVDRDRTRYDAYAALSIEIAGVVGQVIENSKIPKLLNALAADELRHKLALLQAA